MVTIFEYSHADGMLEMGVYAEVDAVEGLRRYLEDIGFPGVDIEALLMGVDVSHGDRHARLVMEEFQIVAEYNEVNLEVALDA